MEALLTVTSTAYIGTSPWRLDLHGGSPERWKPPDGYSNSLFWASHWWHRSIQSHSWMSEALLMVTNYMESLWMMKALLMVVQKTILGLTLTVQTYTESLLNDRSTPDGRYLYRVTPKWRKRSWWSLKSLYRVLTLKAIPMQKFYWKMKALLTSLWQPIFSSYPDD